MDAGKTIIDHSIRIKLKLTTLEYCVADALSQKKPLLPQEICSYIGLNSVQLNQVVSALMTKGIVDMPGHSWVTTAKWKSLFTKKPKLPTLEERMLVFRDSIKPFSQKNGGPYSSDMLRSFYEYWSEPNIAKGKMRFEMEATWAVDRRLIRWATNNKEVDKSRPLINGAING